MHAHIFEKDSNKPTNNWSVCTCDEYVSGSDVSMNELFGFEVGERGAELIAEEDQSGEVDVVFVFA